MGLASFLFGGTKHTYDPTQLLQPHTNHTAEKVLRPTKVTICVMKNFLFAIGKSTSRRDKSEAETLSMW